MGDVELCVVRTEEAGKQVAICNAYIHGIDDNDIPFANARLIAAAPELLAACKRVMQLAVSACGDEIFTEVKTAIAKAEGRAS